MWVFSKHRGEHDYRFLMNLDQCSRINLTPLGEKFFIEVVLGSETIPIAQVSSQEEAEAIQKQVFMGLQAGEKALDLDAPRQEHGEQESAKLSHNSSKNPYELPPRP
jgi:hypothetical protein